MRHSRQPSPPLHMQYVDIATGSALLTAFSELSALMFIGLGIALFWLAFIAILLIMRR